MSLLNEQYVLYQNAAELIINKWTGLRLAIENGMGGPTGIKTAIEMLDYITKYSYNDDVDAHDIATALEEIMEQEFCTYLEDDSPREIGCVLKEIAVHSKQGNKIEIDKILSKLPPGPIWIKETVSHRNSERYLNDVDSDDAMDEDVPAVASTSGATTDMIEENITIDSEWTQVKSRKKRS